MTIPELLAALAPHSLRIHISQHASDRVQVSVDTNSSHAWTCETAADVETALQRALSIRASTINHPRKTLTPYTPPLSAAAKRAANTAALLASIGA